ncbi:YhcH/YjgK/YiaL family protein [Bacteroides heparinolyticus]|uniref:YhcH/YjgK/YiaL family protein n=1 Tax=Prevotella heparinolytica TaxID=28113 RepID=UPI0023F1EB50|nr:YhcH/YjgK/YiaL family protein [Bacteroides heparinolyticus]
MVYDKIDNIETYKGLSEDIYEGLKFLKNTTSDLTCGMHEINPRVKAIVSEYDTKPVNENGYEAHRKFIDIQYLLKGSEKNCFFPIEKLKETKPYKEEIDASFYEADVPVQELMLGEGYFAVYWPQDGHMPCLNSLAQ